MEISEHVITNIVSSEAADSEKTRLLKSESTVQYDLSIHQYHKRPKRAFRLRKAIVMLSCLMQLLICNGIGYGLSVMYAELVVVFNTRRAEAALVQSLNMGLSSGAGILYAGAIKKYGPGMCIAIASVVSSIGLFISAFANGVGFIIVFTGVVAGLRMCVNYLASFVTISLLFYEDPGFFLISLTSGSSLGQFLIPLFYEIFISQYSWSGAFILLSGISLNCLQFALIIHYSRDFYYKGASETKSALKASVFCDRTLLTDCVIWMLWTNFLLLALSGNVEAWFIVDHAVSIGLTREYGSFMVSAVGVGNLMGRIIGSTIRYKCTTTPTIHHWIYLFVLLAVIHVFVVKMTAFLPLLLGCLGIGLTMGTAFAQAPAIMFEASGLDRYTQGMAMVNVMFGVGDIFGTFLGGVIKDVLGVYDLVFYIASGMSFYVCISTIIAVLFMKRRKQKKNKS